MAGIAAPQGLLQPQYRRVAHTAPEGMRLTVGDLPMIEMDRIQKTLAHIVREFAPQKVMPAD
jgi:hypothetical protein